MSEGTGYLTERRLDMSRLCDWEDNNKESEPEKKDRLLYRLCDWEDNGYHDSDFYVALWDAAARRIINMEYASTRYGGGKDIEQYPAMAAASEDVRREFKSWAVDAAADMIFAAKEAEHNEPEVVNHGDVLVTVRKTKKKDGSVVETGVRGDVFWSGAYGKFYRKGYNRPGRGNTRVGLRLDDGTRVFVGLSACKRDGDTEPLEDIRARMQENMDNGGFEILPLTSCRAWLSKSYWM
jgi:hypothetical protein